MNHIICVIDRSGSMNHVREEAIGGFNDFLQKQKDDNTDDVLTFVQFDDKYEVICVRRPLDQVKELTVETFQPRGMTALYDAIGKTIANTSVWSEKEDNTVMLILTDGHENTSREYTKEMVKSQIEHHEKNFGWNVIYVGPDVDAFDVGGGLGVYSGRIVPYNVSKVGTRTAYSDVSQVVTSHKSS